MSGEFKRESGFGNQDAGATGRDSRPGFLWLAVLALVLASAMALAGCTGGTQVAEAYTPPIGNPDRGRADIEQFRCGACHTIPGVTGANGRVAPPLDFFSRRTFVGGEVPNSPDNLVRWIKDPKSIEAGTAMPTLGVSDQQARDIAAYLYTLK